MDYRLIRSDRKSIALDVVDGEVEVRAPLWMPKERIEAFLRKHRHWIEERLRLFEWYEKNYFLLGEPHRRDGESVERIWRRAMEEVVIPRAWELARKFGDRPADIKIGGAKRGWGSCSSKGVINLSYRVAQLPMELVEYVIVHELCHLHHFDHSANFWLLVRSRYGPGYREARKALRRFL